MFVLERYIEAVQMGPHLHAIITAGRNNQKRADAIVRLFWGCVTSLDYPTITKGTTSLTRLSMTPIAVKSGSASCA